MNLTYSVAGWPYPLRATFRQSRAKRMLVLFGEGALHHQLQDLATRSTMLKVLFMPKVAQCYTQRFKSPWFLSLELPITTQ